MQLARHRLQAVQHGLGSLRPAHLEVEEEAVAEGLVADGPDSRRVKFRPRQERQRSAALSAPAGGRQRSPASTWRRSRLRPQADQGGRAPPRGSASGCCRGPGSTRPGSRARTGAQPPSWLPPPGLARGPDRPDGAAFDRLLRALEAFDRGGTDRLSDEQVSVLESRLGLIMARLRQRDAASPDSSNLVERHRGRRAAWAASSGASAAAAAPPSTRRADPRARSAG